MQVFRTVAFLLIVSSTLAGCGGDSTGSDAASTDPTGKGIISSMPPTTGNVDTIKQEGGGGNNFGMPK